MPEFCRWPTLRTRIGNGLSKLVRISAGLRSINARIFDMTVRGNGLGHLKRSSVRLVRLNAMHSSYSTYLRYLLV